jgi:hypothetical protein
MKSKKTDKTIKKHNKEIIERMKMVVNIKKDIDLTINSDITKNDISSFKSHNNRAFYKIIVDFCIKHNVNVIWLIDGVGEMFIQTPQDTANTPEERDLTSKLLAILRRGPDEEMKTVFRNLVNTYYSAYAKAAGNSAGRPDSKGGDQPV